jgi:hypothetical protein
MPASKESIFAFKGKPSHAVDVPEWGGTVYVRVMSGAERDGYEDETYRLNGKSVQLNRVNARARLLVRCLSDEEGKRLFSDADADTLGNQPADVIDKVYSVALRVNGFTEKDVEDLAKN